MKNVNAFKMRLIHTLKVKKNNFIMCKWFFPLSLYAQSHILWTVQIQMFVIRIKTTVEKWKNFSSLNWICFWKNWFHKLNQRVFLQNKKLCLCACVNRHHNCFEFHNFMINAKMNKFVQMIQNFTNLVKG